MGACGEVSAASAMGVTCTSAPDAIEIGGHDGERLLVTLPYGVGARSRLCR